MISLLADAEAPAPRRGARRAVFVAAAVALTGFLAGVAFFLGAWGFDFRRYSQHNGRLQRLMAHEPRMDQVVKALQDEGSPLLASPEGEAALGQEAVGRAGARSAEVLENGRRFPHTRVFLAGDMVYFIYFDDARVMKGFTCVSR